MNTSSIEFTSEATAETSDENFLIERNVDFGDTGVFRASAWLGHAFEDLVAGETSRWVRGLTQYGCRNTVVESEKSVRFNYIYSHS